MDIELKYLSCLFQSSSKLEDAKRLKITPKDFSKEIYGQVYQIMLNSKEMGVLKFNRDMFLSELEPPEFDDYFAVEFNRKKDEDSYDHYTALMIENITTNRQKQIYNSYTSKIEASKDYKERQELREKMISELSTIHNSIQENVSQTMPEIAKNMLKGDIKNIPVPTGFDWLDLKVGGGFYTGLVSIVAAESGHGKSLMMKNCAVRQALPKEYGGKGMKVLIISMELTKEFLTEQILAILSNTAIRENKFYKKLETKGKERQEFETKVKKFSSLMDNLIIEDGSFTPEKLAKRILQAKNEGIQVVWVDYFQHLDINDAGDGNAYNRASKTITKAVKEAKDVAVVALSQVTGDGGKTVKTEQDHQNSKLRYAKQLLQDANLEIILYRNETAQDEPDFENKREEINLFIRKNRNGQPEQHISQPYLSSQGLIGTFKAPDVNKIPDVVEMDLDPVQDLKEMKQEDVGLPTSETPEFLDVVDEMPLPWDEF